jgi:hypothetical protein
MMPVRRLARVLCAIACIASPCGAHGNDNREKAMSGVSNRKAPPPPNVAIGERGLQFRLATVGGEHPTGIVLHGKYVLGQPYFHLYGGQLKAAIRIVAIAQASGQVFTGSPTPPDTNPIIMPEDDEPRPDPTVAPLVSVSGTFDVDLREQLRLPETAGEYGVFLWLDDLVTPLQMAHLPGTDPGDMPVPLPPRHVTLTAPPAAEGGPSPAHGVIGLAIGSGRVTVVLPEERIRALQRQRALPVWMTVFVQAHRTHILAWQSVSLASALEISPHGALSFELFQLIPRPDEPEKLFLLAAVGGALSRIVVVPRQDSRTSP